MTRTHASLNGCKAGVLGAGRSGRAAALLLAAKGAETRVLEKDAGGVPEEFMAQAIASGVGFVFGEHAPEHFADLDLLVMSPGAPVSKIRHFLPATGGPEVLAEMELASRYVREPMLAITGSNGKTTTATLMARMLEQAGKKVFLGGNIGTPLAEYVLQGARADVLVLEVSSFQLQTCSTFSPRTALLLNFAPNHLDYHADLEEYLQAKLNLFRRQGPDDLALFPFEMRAFIEEQKPTAARVRYFSNRNRFSPGKLLGEHNRINMEAAYQATSEYGVTPEQAQAAIDAFEPLAHRLTPVGEKNGVLFVDDSKATTIDAMAAALNSFDRPVRLLTGGVFKGGDLAAVLPLLQEKTKEVGLFGASREVFESAWNGRVPLSWSATLEEAVKKLAANARPGDVVLLSPATASFDLYKNYKERGDDFARIVRECV
jgi:UDP-N-acetylmuramoylalanine--D-glutamate ligase